MGWKSFQKNLTNCNCESYSGFSISFLIYKPQDFSGGATKLKRFTTTIWEGSGWNNEKAQAVLLNAA